MTIEEKRECLLNYCKNHMCSSCGLNRKWTREKGERCIPIRIASEKELDWALEILRSPDPTANPANDSVNHPSHYNQGKYECIDVMVETFGVEATKNFCLLNAFKYIWRTGEKNGAEDIKKAIWYLDKVLDLNTCKEGPE